MTIIYLPPNQVTLPKWEDRSDDDTQWPDFGWARVELDLSRPQDKAIYKKLSAAFCYRGRSEFRIDIEGDTIVFRGFVAALGSPSGTISTVQIKAQGFPHLVDKTGRRKEFPTPTAFSTSVAYPFASQGIPPVQAS